VMYVTLERARERKAEATAMQAAERSSAPGSEPAAGKDVALPAPPAGTV